MSHKSLSYSLQSVKGDGDGTRGAERSPEIDQFVDHFLSLMCDRSRRQILELLATPVVDGQEGVKPSHMERRSTDIARELGLSPATTSEHLRQLSDAKLIAFRRAGNTVYYHLANEMLARAFHDLVLALHKEHTTRLAELAN
jgi:DNA-binding transcriptional ArsR family regulator